MRNVVLMASFASLFNKSRQQLFKDMKDNPFVGIKLQMTPYASIGWHLVTGREKRGWYQLNNSFFYKFINGRRQNFFVERHIPSTFGGTTPFHLYSLEGDMGAGTDIPMWEKYLKWAKSI